MRKHLALLLLASWWWIKSGRADSISDDILDTETWIERCVARTNRSTLSNSTLSERRRACQASRAVSLLRSGMPEATIKAANVSRRLTRRADDPEEDLPSGISMAYFVEDKTDPTALQIGDFLRWGMETIQADGVLAGINIELMPSATEGTRSGGSFGVLWELVTYRAAVFGVGAAYAFETAQTASLFALPYCESSATDFSMLDKEMETLIRTIPDSSQWARGLNKLIVSQGWRQMVNLKTVGGEYADVGLAPFWTAHDLRFSEYHVQTPPADYETRLKEIKSSRRSVIVATMDGPTFAEVLPRAKNLGMLVSDYVWIISKKLFDYVVNSGDDSLTSMMNGFIVAKPRSGYGPVYDRILENWNSTEVLDKYPNLRGLTEIPDGFFFMHSCLELVMRAFKRLGDEFGDGIYDALALGFLGILLDLEFPGLYEIGVVETASGILEFDGNTRMGQHEYFYATAGVLEKFAMYTTKNDSLEYYMDIPWRTGGRPTDSIRLDDSEKTVTLSWILPRVVPPLVGALLLAAAGFLCSVYYYRRRHNRVDREKPSAIGNAYRVPTIDISGPSDRAVDILKMYRDGAKKGRKMDAEHIEFLIDTLTSARSNQPNFLDPGREEADVDAEMRQWVMDITAATGNAGGAGGHGSLPRHASAGSNSLNAPTELAKSAKTGGKLLNAATELGKSASYSAGLAAISSSPATNAAGFETGTLTRRRPSAPGRRSSASLRPMLLSSDVIDGSKRLSIFSAADVSTQMGNVNVSRADVVLRDVDKVKTHDYLNLWYLSWNFDMFHFTEMTNGHPLFFSGMYIVEGNEKLRELDIDFEKMRNWLLMIEQEYHPHPYHNVIHAADVLHALNYLLIEDSIGVHFSPLEVFALVIAAAGHDIDHPGLNNNFLVKSRHEWAILYSDNSVLEFHHSAHVFRKTLTSNCNIFADLSNEEFDELRKMVIRLILATDMGKHFEYINKFKSKISATAPSTPAGGAQYGILKLETNQESRLMAGEIAIKCADLCNPTKTFVLSSKWTECVMQEFYLQGDKERELGLPVSQFMDRTNANVPKCQIGFIDILVAPLYDTWRAFHGTNDKTLKISREIGKNRARWAGLTQSQSNIHAIAGGNTTSSSNSSSQIVSPHAAGMSALSLGRLPTTTTTTTGSHSSSSIASRVFQTSPRSPVVPVESPSQRRKEKELSRLSNLNMSQAGHLASAQSISQLTRDPLESRLRNPNNFSETATEISMKGGVLMNTGNDHTDAV